MVLMRQGKTRLILAIVSTIAEEAAIAFVGLVILPDMGVHTSPSLVIGILAGNLVLDVAIYRVGSRILRKRPVPGFSDMSGSRGRAIAPLDPEGLVMVEGEIWSAQTTDGRIESGAKIVVVRQEGLKLFVRPASSEPSNRQGSG